MTEKTVNAAYDLLTFLVLDVLDKDKEVDIERVFDGFPPCVKRGVCRKLIGEVIGEVGIDASLDTFLGAFLEVLPEDVINAIASGLLEVIKNRTPDDLDENA